MQDFNLDAIIKASSTYGACAYLYSAFAMAFNAARENPDCGAVAEFLEDAFMLIEYP